MVFKRKTIWFTSDKIYVNGKCIPAKKVSTAELTIELIYEDCLIQMDEPWARLTEESILLNNNYYYHAHNKNYMTDDYLVEVVTIKEIYI